MTPTGSTIPQSNLVAKFQNIPPVPPSRPGAARVCPEPGGPQHGPAGDPLVLREIEEPLKASRLLVEWENMLAASTHPGKLYQSPSYFKSILESSGKGSIRLFALYGANTGRLAAVVPVRFLHKSLRIGGTAVGLTRTIPVLQVLGGPPLARHLDSRGASLYTQLLQAFPQGLALLLPIYPADEAGLGELAQLRRARVHHLLEHGVEDCHVIDLPPQFSEYEAKLSAKKRYNLRRQARQLEQHAGPLRLDCVREEGQVAALFQAIEGMGAQLGLGERTVSALARSGLLQSYVLYAGEQAVAAAFGKRCAQTWHVTNIFTRADLPAAYSVGTTLMHRVLEHLIDSHGLAQVDFGFGSPGHAFSSTQRTEPRARVLLYRPSLGNRISFGAYRVLTAWAGRTSVALREWKRKRRNAGQTAARAQE
jgi:hypothetical protein